MQSHAFYQRIEARSVLQSAISPPNLPQYRNTYLDPDREDLAAGEGGGSMGEPEEGEKVRYARMGEVKESGEAVE